MTINTAAVRKLARKETAARRLLEDTLVADVQRMTVRCYFCDWFLEDVLVADGKRESARHRRTHRGRRK